MQTAAMSQRSALWRLRSACIPGYCERQMSPRLRSPLSKQRRRQRPERSYGYFFCMSGPNSATAGAAYARTRQRVIEDGDLVMIHANTCADGYWTDLTRTYIAGEPSERQRDIRAAIAEARTAGLRADPSRRNAVNRSTMRRDPLWSCMASAMHSSMPRAMEWGSPLQIPMAGHVSIPSRLMCSRRA